MDNEQDRKAWDLLQRVSEEENTSKNAVALKLICMGVESTGIKDKTSLDVVAERIAEQVAKILADRYGTIEKSSGEERVSERKLQQEPPSEELRPISEEVLSFLDEF